MAPTGSTFLPVDDGASDDSPARPLDAEEEEDVSSDQLALSAHFAETSARREGGWSVVGEKEEVKNQSENQPTLDPQQPTIASQEVGAEMQIEPVVAVQNVSSQEIERINTPKLSDGFYAAAHTHSAKRGSLHTSQVPHTNPVKPYEAVFHIETDKIKPNPQQPRRHFDENAIHELAASIREFGILQPLVVTKHEFETDSGTGVEYFLIAGERRLLASKYLGLERVPAVIRQVDLPRERLELAIIENLQRENLNPVEMGRAFARLQDEFRLTQREIAGRLGKSRESIANTMRLLDLPPYIMEAVETGRITESHGRLLLAVTDPRAQEKLFYDLTQRNMSVRVLKSRVDELRQSAHPAVGEEVSPEMIALQNRLSQELGTPVKIQKGKEGGKITISFYSEEELQGLLAKLDKNTDSLGY
jgi:ParB family chromosome partitioning protein